MCTWALSRPLLHCERVPPAGYHRPGFSDAGPRVRPRMPQPGQDGNPKRRRVVHAFMACGASGRHLHPNGNGWNRSIWPMLCIGEMPVNHVCWVIVRIFALAAPMSVWVLWLESAENDAVRQWVAMRREPCRKPLSFRLARPPSPVPAVACKEGDRQPVSPASAGRTRTRRL
jgi:hypothetical protein